MDFLRGQDGGVHGLKMLDLYIRPAPHGVNSESAGLLASPIISAVIYPNVCNQRAKVFWQHTGQGASSRRTEVCLEALGKGFLEIETVTFRRTLAETTANTSTQKGPKRYQKPQSRSHEIRTEAANTRAPNHQSHADTQDYAKFIEERFGRNLNLSHAAQAKAAIRKRIAGALIADAKVDDLLKSRETVQDVSVTGEVSDDDVYLFPTGMSSIFDTHRLLRLFRGEMRSICYGFPYIDTLKILEKWGKGCLFYGHGSAADLDDLDRRCKSGEKFLALFCEFPGNPLLKTPDLLRIRALADRYDFAVIVDETIGSFINIHVISAADIIVSSLTKVFSGDSNVMGGSAILNPRSRYYPMLKQTFNHGLEDNYWPEDAVFMERNSRDFVSRIHRINSNAEVICQTLLESPLVKKVYYPKYSSTKSNYDRFRTKAGGYGGLLSITFNSKAAAISFYDALEAAKGPSLGTNFTLVCPFVLLAHYNELDWALSFGVEADLIRVSVGLEDAKCLCAIFQRALDAVSKRVQRPDLMIGKDRP